MVRHTDVHMTEGKTICPPPLCGEGIKCCLLQILLGTLEVKLFQFYNMD